MYVYLYILCMHVCIYIFYLNKYSPEHYLILLTKPRLLSHTLAVEMDRYKNIERMEIMCMYCNLNIIEDEYNLFTFYYNVVDMTI